MGLEHRNIVPSVVVGCLSLSARSLLSALCAGCIIKLYTKKCEQIEGVWRICKKIRQHKFCQFVRRTYLLEVLFGLTQV